MLLEEHAKNMQVRRVKACRKSPGVRPGVARGINTTDGYIAYGDGRYARLEKEREDEGGKGVAVAVNDMTWSRRCIDTPRGR